MSYYFSSKNLECILEEICTYSVKSQSTRPKHLQKRQMKKNILTLQASLRQRKNIQEQHAVDDEFNQC